MAIAQAVHDGTQADTVNGAQSYYSGNNPPIWAAKMTKVCEVGDFSFFRV